MRGLGLGNKLPKIILPVILLNLILSITLVKYLHLGLTGVAIPTAISWFIMLIFTLFELKKELRFKLDSKLNYILILNFIFIAIVLILKNHYLVYLTYFKIILILGFSYLIYLILGYLFKIYTIEQLYIFIPEEIRPKIRKFHQKYFKFLK